MKTSLSLVPMLLAGSLFAAGLPRSTPEAQGVSSGAVRSFLEAANQAVDSLHSFMLVRHGNVVAEGWWQPYDAQSPHMLFSLSKSFTSTAVGLAIAEGRFTLDDEVARFFPGDAPAQPGRNLNSMRVRDLLRMSTGHQTEPPRPAADSWKKAFLNHPVEFKPGTHFLYNTPATYMCSAIVEKTTGMPLLEYLRPRLFDPLGIENPTWEKSPEGIAFGGSGLSVRTEDIARFGQLYLQNGRWQGKQLVPEHWVREATSFQTSNGSNPLSDWDQGYGYQFWRCRHNAFRGDGAFGQYCIVLPEQDAVVAITAGLGDMQAVLNLVWDKLLPGMHPSPLPADESACSKLTSALKSLALPTQAGAATGRATPARSYTFPANDRKLESLALKVRPDGSASLTMRVDGVDRQIECGYGAWKRGRLARGTQTMAAAATGAWTSDDTYTAKLCFTETPFVHTLSFKFSGAQVRYNNRANVGFGPTTEPELVGNAAP